MKDGIHPNYVETMITCACGNSFTSHSTQKVIKLDICAKCHPFFTGTQKLLDTAGRVERFEKRFSKTAGETVKKDVPVAKAAKGQKLVTAASIKKFKVLSSAPEKAKPTAGKPVFTPKTPAAGKPGDKPAAAKPGDKPATQAH